MANVNEVISVLSEFSSALKLVYKDALQPGVRQVGKALETCLGFGNTILLPLWLYNERTRACFEKSMDEYRIKIVDRVSVSAGDEKVTGVSPEIGSPIIEKFAQVDNDILRSAYVNLLVNASFNDTASLVHPMFVSIVSFICPDEVLILELLYKNDRIPMLTSEYLSCDDVVGSGVYLTGIERIGGLQFPDNIPAYLQNLSGQGVIEIYDDKEIHSCDEYLELERFYTASEMENNPNPSIYEHSFVRGKIVVSHFGLLFLQAVHLQ